MAGRKSRRYPFGDTLDTYDFGIRRIYDPSRSRSFRSSLRDTEARRGTPQTGCEESESARTKAKTSPPLFSRFKRPTLKMFRWYLSHLAGNLGQKRIGINRTSRFHVGANLAFQVMLASKSELRWREVPRRVQECPRWGLCPRRR